RRRGRSEFWSLISCWHLARGEKRRARSVFHFAAQSPQARADRRKYVRASHISWRYRSELCGRALPKPECPQANRRGRGKQVISSVNCRKNENDDSKEV